jgi:hypothetical protein
MLVLNLVIGLLGFVAGILYMQYRRLGEERAEFKRVMLKTVQEGANDHERYMKELEDLSKERQEFHAEQKKWSEQK